ncbi:MAG: UDP-N-acetylmuramoyl-L-alanyl-D-glutamate--2,6-diaminopimelate ligase [Gemmatimonadota bacterium]
MTLADLISALRSAGLLVRAPDVDVPVTGVTDDSRAVRPGGVFVAVRGSQADGHRFLGDAVVRGASAVVVEAGKAPAGVPAVEVHDGRRAAIALGRAWYGDPGARLTLVAITGTNGKTTTTALIRHLFNAAGHAGSIGTLGAFDGAGQPVASTAGNLTTPGAIDLQATLAGLLERGVSHVAMEASSHSLDQGRLDGLTFAAAVYTNFTRDHLDYHGTMERYLAAKLRLSEYLGPDGVEVVNADEPAWAALKPRAGRVTFGVGNGAAADVVAADAVSDATGSRFRLTGRFGDAPVSLPLLGDFNVANATAAAATALALGRPIAEVAARLTAAPQVPGRMERIAVTPCVVLRDYAHTPDALERALRTLRPLTAGRLIVVFGCGGDRDRGKRPIMGRIAAELADVPVVTSDNPRTEDPDAIIDEIEAGMNSVPRIRETDRHRAIARALELARPGDTILLAGKGHEDYQVLGTTKVPFDEREIVAALGGKN